MKIAESLPHGAALQTGQRAATKSLAATFKILESGILESGRAAAADVTEHVDTSVFRKPFPMSKMWKEKGEIFVQKAGTRREGYTAPGARLASVGEKMEIRAAAAARQAPKVFRRHIQKLMR